MNSSPRILKFPTPPVCAAQLTVETQNPNFTVELRIAVRPQTEPDLEPAAPANGEFVNEWPAADAS